MPACIRNQQPDCTAQAVIPSITVDSVEGITNLANCLVHVSDINTTFYIDDKHRVMITWAGPVNIPGYDMENNPEGFKDQIVLDTEKELGVIYDKNGVGYTFGIKKDADITDVVSEVLAEMVDDGTIEELINQDIFSALDERVAKNATDISELDAAQANTQSLVNNLQNQSIAQAQDINTLEVQQVQNVKKSEPNSVSMNMLNSEVKDAITGGAAAVVGADSVGTENIQDKAVTILKLDDNLRNNFDIQMTKIDLGDGTPGFYQVTGDVVGGNVGQYLPSQNVNQCYAYNLEKGKTYRYTGYNYSLTHGLVIGTAVGEPALALSPSTGALNQGVYTGLQNDIYGTDILFTVTDDDLIAFITKFDNSHELDSGKVGLLKDYGTLYEVTDVTPYDRTVQRDIWQEMAPDYTYTKYYMQFVVAEGTEINNRNPYRLSYIDNTNYKIRLYKIYKNHKYKATGTQRWANSGFALYDNSCQLVYVSQSVESSVAQSFTYEFTAESDGFAITQDTSATLTATLSEAVEASEYSSRLSNMTIAYNGDSITESRLNESLTTYNGGAYPKIIADITGGYYQNFAVGGGTLAQIDTSHHQIVNDIVNMTGEYDAIIISGGINDYWKNVPLGTYTEGDYTSEVDKTTICGALESIFRQAINKWCGKPIMFVITHKIGGTAFTPNTAGYTFDDVHEKIVGICHKYSIPYYDAYQDSGLNSYLDIMNTTFMTAGASGHPDHTHPNKSAYEKYYVPQVIQMLEANLEY